VCEEHHLYICGTNKQKENKHDVVSLLLIAATVWSFPRLLFGLSNHNKVGLWPGCEGGARCNLHKKIYVARTSNNKSDLVGWFLLLLAVTVWSFAHLPFELFDRNTRNLLPCLSHAQYMKMSRVENVGLLGFGFESCDISDVIIFV